MASRNNHTELLISSPSGAYLHSGQDRDLVQIGFQLPNDLVSITKANEVLHYNSYPPRFGPEEDYPPSRAPFYTQDTLTSDLVQQFPQSTSLYFAMCEQFGSHNIAPLPQLLADSSDHMQKQWFKSGPNAFLYFLHKAPKHKARVRALANQPLCCTCEPCVSKHMGNVYQMNRPGHYCWACLKSELVGWLFLFPLPCLVCCCTDFNFTRRLHLRYHGSGFSGVEPAIGDSVWWQRYATNCCCVLCPESCRYETTIGVAPQLYSTILKDVDAMSETPIGSALSPATAICTECWCGPCINTRHHAIIDYLFYKRYGIALNKAIDTGGRGAKWMQFFPSYFTNSPPDKSSQRLSPHQTLRTREANPVEEVVHVWEVDSYNETDGDTTTTYRDKYQGPFPIYPLSIDLIDVPKAVEYHNRLWAGVHKVLLPQHGFERDHGVNSTKLTALEMG